MNDKDRHPSVVGWCFWTQHIFIYIYIHICACVYSTVSRVHSAAIAISFTANARDVTRGCDMSVARVRMRIHRQRRRRSRSWRDPRSGGSGGSSGGCRRWEWRVTGGDDGDVGGGGGGGCTRGGDFPPPTQARRR